MLFSSSSFLWHTNDCALSLSLYHIYRSYSPALKTGAFAFRLFPVGTFHRQPPGSFCHLQTEPVTILPTYRSLLMANPPWLPSVKAKCLLLLLLFFSLSISFSPWYNRTGWLGVTHQFTYLPFPSLSLYHILFQCLSVCCSKEANCHKYSRYFVPSY